MIVLILSAIDLICGGLLLLNLNFFLNYIAGIMLLKGAFSILSSLGVGYWFDWMGWIDLIGAAALLLFAFGIPAAVFTNLAWIIVFKGVYSLLRGLLQF
jgi:hypothetical protein